jgi:hypothetical protein
VEHDCDVLVVGAGCGGVAAALAATRAGRRVVLTEPTTWVGGQLTSQAVPPDEHPWVEDTGVTRSYRQMREAVRERYRAHPHATTTARRRRDLNPGRAWVSRIAAEPRVWHEVLLQALAPARQHGLLTLLTEHEPVEAYVDRDRVEAVTFRDATTGETVSVSAAYVLDATEEGDLLPLTGCEHVLGAESRDDTGEPHALDGPAEPWDHQAVTWCAALELRPGAGDPVTRPESYDFWRGYQAAHWPGPQLGWATAEPETGNTLRRPLFGADDEQDLWSFRRIRYGAHFDPARTDITLVNWPQIDYWLAPLTGCKAEERAAARDGARDLTLSFVHWLQTEAPRHDGGHGYPELQPVGDPLGTGDGLAMEPYIREARRIRAHTTVLEQHVGVEARDGAATAEELADSVGVGSYRIDLHPSTGGRGYLDIATYPFQVPLGALLPQRLGNLIAAGKCLGVTHITNGCYRLHPVEWNVGEAAGALAAYCLDNETTPAAVRAGDSTLEDFQRSLDRMGVQRHWPDDIKGQAR